MSLLATKPLSRIIAESESGEHTLQTRLEAGAEMRAHMKDDTVRFDRAGDVDRVHERAPRLLVDRIVRRGEVDEVEGVTNDSLNARLGAALLEALEVRRIVVRRAPGARALREDLEGLAADRLDAVDGRVDPA